MKTIKADEGTSKNLFNVILLGIVFDTKKKKILIGKREKEDIDMPNLTWVFPGGRPSNNEELESTLKRKIKEETGLKVEILGVVFAKTYPENRKILSIYYLCESLGGKEKPSGDIKELKWVSPEEVEKYFTTSFHPHLKEYILNLK